LGNRSTAAGFFLEHGLPGAWTASHTMNAINNSMKKNA
jgi:hypothetical protein